MQVKVWLLITCALCLSMGTVAARADSFPVPVSNPSFESSGALPNFCGSGCNWNNGPIPGWTVTGDGGSWQPNSSYFDLSTIDGSTVAYSNGGTISEDLGDVLLPDSTYTLSVDVGRRSDFGYTADYSIGLFDGTTPLAVYSDSNGSIAPGTFALETVSYSTGDTAPGDLTIVLSSSGPQVDFDNVSLVDPTNTPEPSSLALLGVGFGLIALLYKFGTFMPSRRVLG